MQIARVQQITDSHCGPAVLEILLQHVGVSCDQDLITKAADAIETIDEEGTTIDELALACSRVAPESQFWFKFHSSIEDIEYILGEGYPVAVEWQGLFYNSENEEKNHGLHGHYSIVIGINKVDHTITIRDPYKEYSHFDRVFSLDMFKRRWWDTNNILDPVTEEVCIIEDFRALFFVTPLHKFLLPDYKFEKYSLKDHITRATK